MSKPHETSESPPRAALDVIIPVYNEGENIIDVLEGLRRHVRTDFRIMICYDFDEDNTLEALAGYPHAEALNITYVKNTGEGVFGAVMTGFSQVQSDAVLVFPADDTFNAGIVDAMVERYRQGCDVVAASRFMKGGVMRGCPWLKAVLVRSAAFTLYYVARLPTHDPTSGFKLFSRRLIDTITPTTRHGWAFCLELVVKCHRMGWPIGEVPAVWFERTKGTSRFRVIRWLPQYLKWYRYAFATTYLRRRAV